MGQQDKNRIRFWFFTIFYCEMTVADLGLTYLATPNLEMEGNPLVAEYALGWGTLLFVNALTLVAYIFMAWYAFYRYRPRLSAETKNMKRYLSDITYDDPTLGKFGMLHLPKHWAPQMACLCYSVVTALPFARSIIVAEWILLYTDAYAPWFFRIVAFFPLGRIDFFVAILLAWILSSVWIYREFRENKKQVLSLKSANR